MIGWKILFWMPVLLLFHSYVLYPWILQWLSKGKSLRSEASGSDESLPHVSVLMAAYNEEKVLTAKLKSIFQSDYPANRLELIVGSDASTDATNSIIQSFINQGYNIVFREFGGRTGKSGILNQLYPLAQGSIFIPTDANILFEPDMIRRLVASMQHESIGLVSANIVNTGMQHDGISYQEEAYIQRENIIKYREGVVWGTMIGAFGACYAIRKELFVAIPPNFLMEDFYISLSVLERGYDCVCDLHAVAKEDVSNLLKEEFKRKIRISAGNYQNLNVFAHLLWPPWKPLGFSFLSHKVIRWLGPFLLLLAFIASIFLLQENLFYRIAFFLQLAGFATPLIDAGLKRINLHNFALRLIAYFYSMNAALLMGLLRYWKGIKTSAWNPTVRNIEQSNGKL